MENNQYIYLLPLNSRYLLYSPLTKTSALINRKAALEIRKILGYSIRSSDIPEPLNNLITSIKNVKYHPEKKKGKINPAFLGIIPTRQCNGACNYCDFEADNASNQIMTLRMAANAVDWYTGIVKKNKGTILKVHFFGGEPMVAMDVVETVVHRTRYNASSENLQSVLEISTNGQYSAEDAEFVGNYFTSVILSLDGFEDTQNTHRPLKNRKGSFSNAVSTGKIISDSQAQLGLRSCVSNKNVHQMAEIASWFCEEFKPFTINFEGMRETSGTMKKGLSSPDPFDFAVNLSKARKICESHCVPLVYATDITDYPGYSSCPVGKDTAIISPDGRISSCYLMPEKWERVNMHLDFGQIHNNEIQINKENLNFIRKIISDKPGCSKCFCRWSCAGGCHISNTFPGAKEEYTDFCIQTRIISLCTLLSDLGMNDDVAELLDDRTIMKTLALQKSDLLLDMK